MKSQRKIVTIFSRLENVHLTKSLGQIPYFLFKKYGFEATIVTYNNDNYDYLENEVKGLKLFFIKNRGKFFQCEIAIISYLINNAHKIPILNLYHFAGPTYIYGIVYKLLNPRGLIFLKSDIDYYFFKDNYPIIYFKNKLKNSIVYIFSKIFLRIVTIITVETQEGRELLNHFFGLSNKLIVVPNGIDISYFKKKIPIQKHFNQKENLIITVGRIGLEVKNHTMLLQLGALIDLKKWKILFIGPVDQSFRPVISKFFIEHPNLNEKIIFTGQIESKEELFDYYDKSKIFILTSNREGTPTVIAEALFFGLYFISTDCSVWLHSLKKNNLVEIVPLNDLNGMKNILQIAINDEDKLKDHYLKCAHSSMQLFDWGENIDELANTLIDELELNLKNNV